MSKLARGIKEFEKALESKGDDNDDSNYTRYFKINDGESVLVRFLQEIDPDSEYANEDVGTATLATYVSPPKSVDPEGWKRKYIAEGPVLDKVQDWDFGTRLIINLLREVEVEDDDGNTELVEQVQLWDASKTVAREIFEHAIEEGAITDRYFKIKRRGEGTDTQYIIMPKAPDGGIDVTEYADDVTQAEEYLLELTPEAYAKEVGESSDDTDTDAGTWVA